MTTTSIRKKPVAMRLKPELLKQIDEARDLAKIDTRTAFVEQACEMFASHIQKTSY